MATKAKQLDVWLTDGNVVYKEVPFTVVVDWIQQGRLLEEDQVRLSGTDRWVRIASSRALAAYLPKPEPYRVEDEAEVLEPVAVEFSWKRRHGDDEDDPDMIPLIDISLVLLVFFMMTTTVIVASTNIDVPAVYNSSLFNSTGSFWIGIDRRQLSDGREGPPAYSFGEAEKAAEAENRALSEAQVVERLGNLLRERNERVEVRIAADRRLPAEIVISLRAALEPLRQKGYLRGIRAEVSEKKP
jgi:biopolymer transport protein ExbD